MSRKNSVRRDRARRQHGGKPADARQTSGPSSFAWFAHEVARLAGKPATFLAALAIVIAWAATGPIFGYSDTWQLVINTSTTIITFLMVFIIQNTQNRDTLAIQAKLAELIIHMHGAPNKMAAAEDLSDDELEALHETHRARAEAALAIMKHRKSRS